MACYINFKENYIELVIQKVDFEIIYQFNRLTYGKSCLFEALINEFISYSQFKNLIQVFIGMVYYFDSPNYKNSPGMKNMKIKQLN
jgi:hypothetical protein